MATEQVLLPKPYWKITKVTILDKSDPVRDGPILLVYLMM